MMKHNKILFAIALIEILIGIITFLAVFLSLVLSSNTKSPNVLIFVIVASLISTLLGMGILQHKKIACDLLIYFSSVVLLSKVLIFADILALNGTLETTLHPNLKNAMSILYHAFVIFYLNRKEIKESFVTT